MTDPTVILRSLRCAALRYTAYCLLLELFLQVVRAPSRVSASHGEPSRPLLSPHRRSMVLLLPSGVSLPSLARPSFSMPALDLSQGLTEPDSKSMLTLLQPQRSLRKFPLLLQVNQPFISNTTLTFGLSRSHHSNIDYG